jgi:hypothetical protein
MNRLKIETATGRTTSKADFGVRVVDDRLEVPEELAEALRRLSVRTPEELVAIVESFPSAVADALGWEEEDVRQAQGGLIKELRGSVPDALLATRWPPAPATGARNPFEVAGTDEDEHLPS